MVVKSKDRSIQELTIVDSDVHVADNSADVLPYLNDPYDKLLRDDIVSGDRPINMFPRSGDLHPSRVGHFGNREIGNIEDAEATMEMFGTDQMILNGSTFLRTYGIRNNGLGHAMSVAYNDWLLDRFLDNHPDLYGVMSINHSVPNKAAEEIDERASEEKIIAVMIPSGVVPPFGNEFYDPIYSAAEEAGLPIASHICGLNTPIHFPHQWIWNEAYIDHKAPSFPAEYMHHISNMLSKGVPIKYPDLDFVIMEAGLGWVPFFLERYDHLYHGSQHEIPMLEKKPSDYIRDNVYFSTQPVEGIDNPRYIDSILRLIGPENLLFATDYPHHDFDHTEDIHKIFRREFDRSELEKVFGENAKAVFSI